MARQSLAARRSHLSRRVDEAFVPSEPRACQVDDVTRALRQGSDQLSATLDQMNRGSSGILIDLCDRIRPSRRCIAPIAPIVGAQSGIISVHSARRENSSPSRPAAVSLPRRV
jgi:hypothetical protein